MTETSYQGWQQRVLALCLLLMLTPMLKAVELGELVLHSRMDQPLDFSVPLFNVDNLDNVTISLASPAAYQAKGLAYAPDLAKLQLSIENGQVRGQTSAHWREPALYLLLNISWPEGRVLLERSTIVDLPLRYQTQDSAITTAKPTAESSVAAAQLKQAERPISKTSTETLGERRHRVQRGEVLSLLAQTYRGNVDIPLHRYIRAIKSANSQLFPQGLDRLEPDMVVLMPDPKTLLNERLDQVVVPEHQGQEWQQYTVRYGDKLSVLAQQFRGDADIPLKAYMASIVQANADRLDEQGIALKSGMVLDIPSPQWALKKGLEDEQGIASRFEEQEVQAETIQPVELALPESVVPENDDSHRPLDATEAAVSDIVTPTEDEPAEVEPELDAQVSAIEESTAYVVETNPQAYMNVETVSERIIPEQLELPASQGEEGEEGVTPAKVYSREPSDSILLSIIKYALLLVIVLLLLAVAVFAWRKRRADPLVELDAQIADDREADDLEPEVSVTTPPIVDDEVVDDSPHDQTLRLDLNKSEPAHAQFTSAEQNEVRALLEQDKLHAAEKKADQLIYSQPGEFKNWLIKLEVLAKQGKRERCMTLATQVRGKFKQAVHLNEVDALLAQYFDKEEDSFVPEDFSGSSQVGDLASEINEVKVYLSYGFYDMAERTLDKLLPEYPRHRELPILYIETLLGLDRRETMQSYADSLLAADSCTEQQRHQIKEILQRAEQVAVEVASATMDIDLTEPDVATPVHDLMLDDEDIEHLDLEVDDLEEAIDEALGREEAQERAHPHTDSNKSETS